MKDFFRTVYSLITTQIEINNISLPFNFLELLIRFILPMLVGVIIYKLIKRWTGLSVDKSKFQEDKKETLKSRIFLGYRIALLLYSVVIFINLFGAQINNTLASFGGVLTHPIVEGISMVTILLIIPIIYLSQVMGKVAYKFAAKTIFSYVKMDIGSKQTLLAVIKNVTIVLVILLGLTVIGIDLTIIFGLFGVVGLGLGFGLQGVVANLFAGVVILTSRPVKVGDHILVDGTEGNLKEIRFLNSVVSTITHESIIIPNSKLIENPVHNYSFDDPSIIIKTSVQVSYSSDLDEVMAILVEVGKKCPYLLKYKEVIPRVYSFDDSGISVGVICWIKDSSHKYDASSWLNLEVWRAFKEKGVEIPFPQVDLHIKRGN